jgi:DNA polymerase
LLDRMIEAIGLDRTQVYIANIVPWRPPGNRTPTPHESAICLPFIRRQIELADPDILVCLGQPSTQTLLETKEGITRTRGRWFKFDTGSREIRALATYHPAFLLRSPLQKRLAWRDFLAIKKALAP